MSKTLASVLSNLSFGVNYNTSELEPQVELVILCWKPSYETNAKGEVKKKSSLEEVRIDMSTKGLNQLIAELQVVSAELLKYEQMGESLNRVINSMKVNK